MVATASLFHVERVGPTLILTPATDLREYEAWSLDAAAEEILDLFEDNEVRNVVLDFHDTNYFGSSALGFFIRLWKRTRVAEGRMAFCQMSNHEREILSVTGLEGLWPLFATRAEALRYVEG